MSKLHKAIMIAAVIFGIAALGFIASAGSTQQDPQTLDRRISMLEQRLFLIESRLNRLEQQSAINLRTPGIDQGRAENERLGIELATVKSRISELQCGLAKLDERTLPTSERESRRRDGSTYRDPCRANPETPVQLTRQP